MIRKFLQDESGATAIEYGLIACLISVVCIAVWRIVGQDLFAVFNSVARGLGGAA
jgi:pilus assembly protein Flp/PilA